VLVRTLDPGYEKKIPIRDGKKILDPGWDRKKSGFGWKKSGFGWKKYRYGMNIPDHFSES
jgi:hypothetical protein